MISKSISKAIKFASGLISGNVFCISNLSSVENPREPGLTLLAGRWFKLGMNGGGMLGVLQGRLQGMPRSDLQTTPRASHSLASSPLTTIIEPEYVF